MSALKPPLLATADMAKQGKTVSLPERMVLAAFGGMGAASFCHPIDTVRINMQIRQYAGGMDAIRNIIKPGIIQVRGDRRCKDTTVAPAVRHGVRYCVAPLDAMPRVAMPCHQGDILFTDVDPTPTDATFATGGYHDSSTSTSTTITVTVTTNTPPRLGPLPRCGRGVSSAVDVWQLSHGSLLLHG